MRMLALVLGLITIFAIGFGVNYLLQDISAFVILKNIIIFYIIGVVIIEGLLIGFKKESQEAKVDTNKHDKN